MMALKYFSLLSESFVATELKGWVLIAMNREALDHPKPRYPKNVIQLKLASST